MTDVTGGPVPSSTPSRRDLEDLGTETELNGLSSGDESLGSLEGAEEGRSFGAATGATGLGGASSSGAFTGGAQSSGGFGSAASEGESAQSSRATLLQDGKQVASAKARQAREWAGEFGSRQTDTFKNRVVEKPLETSVAVFGLGLIVGLLLRR
jgi:hypothetical protein